MLTVDMPSDQDITSCDVIHTMRIIRALRESRNPLDAAQFFEDSWEFVTPKVNQNDGSAEFRKPAPLCGEYIVKFELTPNTTAYDILRRAFDLGMLTSLVDCCMDAVIQEDEGDVNICDQPSEPSDDDINAVLDSLILDLSYNFWSRLL